MIPLNLLVLLVGIVTRLLLHRSSSRALRAASPSSSQSRSIHVLLCADADGPWRARVTDLLTRAQARVDVSVLLECTGSESEAAHDAADSILGGAAHIELGLKRRNIHPSAMARRLLRRFVVGDERVVVLLLHPDVHLVAGWGKQVEDHLLHHLTPPNGQNAPALLSCPTASGTGYARFPVLRVRSTGAVARDSSIPFAQDDGKVRVVDSVCWCPEVTLMSAATAQQWSVTDSFVDQAPHHQVVTRPLAHYSESAEDDLLAHDEGSHARLGRGDGLRPCEQVGLTPTADTRERVAKYGSVIAARAKVANA